MSDTADVFPELVAVSDEQLAMSAQLSDVPPTAYEHVMADGTVYRAETAEQVIRECPFLGKMAAEQVALLLEIAAIDLPAPSDQPPAVKRRESSPEPLEKTLAKPSIDLPVMERRQAVPARSVAPEATVPGPHLDERVVFEELLPPDTSKSSELPAQQTDEEDAGRRLPSAVPVPRPAVVYPESGPEAAEPPAPVLAVQAEEIIQDQLPRPAERSSVAALIEAPPSGPPYRISTKRHAEEIPREDVLAASSQPSSPIAEAPAAAPAAAPLPEAQILQVDSSVGQTRELAGPVPANQAVEEPIEFAEKSDQTSALPPERADDPTETLADLFEAARPVPVIGAETTEAVSTSLDERPPATEPQLAPAELPAVAGHAIERIRQLAPAERTAVMPLAHELAAAAQAVESLRAPGAAEPEVVAAAQSHLEKQIVCLFEQLDLSYQPEDIKIFARLAVSSKSWTHRVSPAEQTPAADLEHDGTREAKVHWPHTATGFLATMVRDTKRTLGSLSVLQLVACSAL